MARLTAERDEARAHLINLVQVGWLGPYGLIPSGMGSSWRGWADMDNDPAPNWVPVYRFATQEATALAAHDDPSAAIDVVNEQAEDEGLWFVAKTMPEAYLQQELRRLHAAVEAG